MIAVLLQHLIHPIHGHLLGLPARAEQKELGSARFECCINRAAALKGVAPRDTADVRTREIRRIVLQLYADIMVARDGEIGDIVLKLIVALVEDVPLFRDEAVIDHVARLHDVTNVFGHSLLGYPAAHVFHGVRIIVIGYALRIGKPDDGKRRRHWRCRRCRCLRAGWFRRCLGGSERSFGVKRNGTPHKKGGRNTAAKKKNHVQAFFHTTF